MTRLNELRLISRVAQMYHLEGRRQAEIAQHLRLSQATVSRMLKRAEAEGCSFRSTCFRAEPASFRSAAERE